MHNATLIFIQSTSHSTQAGRGTQTKQIQSSSVADPGFVDGGATLFSSDLGTLTKNTLSRHQTTIVELIFHLKKKTYSRPMGAAAWVAPWIRHWSSSITSVRSTRSIDYAISQPFIRIIQFIVKTQKIVEIPEEIPNTSQQKRLDIEDPILQWVRKPYQVHYEFVTQLMYNIYNASGILISYIYTTTNPIQKTTLHKRHGLSQ